MKKIKIKIKTIVVVQPVSCCCDASSSSRSSLERNAQAVTLAQAARAWGMSERTLRRRVKSGLIQAVKPRDGAALRIEAATVNALLAARWCPKERDEADANAEDVW